jgi:hypothetical protein
MWVDLSDQLASAGHFRDVYEVCCRRPWIGLEVFHWIRDARSYGESVLLFMYVQLDTPYSVRSIKTRDYARGLEMARQWYAQGTCDPLFLFRLSWPSGCNSVLAELWPQPYLSTS